MELVLKIFQTLDITLIAVFQMGLVVGLAIILSVTLVRPVLTTFQERENRSVKPLEESKRLLADAEARTRQHDESLRKAAAEALARKRARMEEASRAERKGIEAVVEETNRKINAMKEQIEAEKETSAQVLRSEVARLSQAIAEKVLGRRVA
ncbi:MAG TPA: ATP synthase F0 subunit B [Candidatus Deferrimicrobiaceae bacterium]|nr:ATP synthase F0 subunit B [Candidatus Deferrimicrobiaceae bacterium]